MPYFFFLQSDATKKSIHELYVSVSSVLDKYWSSSFFADLWAEPQVRLLNVKEKKT